MMRAGSNDSIKVWLNGQVIHRNAVNSGAGDFQDTFNGDLKKEHGERNKERKT